MRTSLRRDKRAESPAISSLTARDWRAISHYLPSIRMSHHLTPRSRKMKKKHKSLKVIKSSMATLRKRIMMLEY